jgi:hypothetical protein
MAIERNSQDTQGIAAVCRQRVCGDGAAQLADQGASAADTLWVGAGRRRDLSFKHCSVAESQEIVARAGQPEVERSGD